MAAHDSGAAWRRRQRRLRSWWRHEQQSIAAVLATVSHHSFPKVDTANAALQGQKTGTSTRGPAAAEFFTLSDEESELAGGMRPQPLCDVAWPLPVVRAASRVELMAPSLDVPSLQDEEVDGSAFLAFVTASQQEIVQEIPEVCMPSACERALQPMDIEQVLDVPVLREIDFDFKLAVALAHFEQLLVQETPEVQVLTHARVDSLHDVQEQVIVRESPELQASHVQSGRLGVQVVDVPVPHQVHFPQRRDTTTNCCASCRRTWTRCYCF